ncbi:S1/P1 Nuclease [Musa troglodytarum]|nr:S1/P1 Nuclease [Musa troglodytarum]URE29818.1 S1/P1 Nuclease [Musa troglodytarum]
MGRFLFFQAVICLMVLYAVPVAQSWGKEGHILTCRIAQELFQPEAAEAVKNLLQDSVNGDLSALCSWPDEVRHLPHYQRMSSLHFVNTPDEACTFDYSRDCKRDECVVGAISEFTSQLLHYNEEPADPQYNMTEALLFLSHFIGDIHQA